MKMLRVYWVLQLLVLTAYTVPVIQDHGINLAPLFVGAIAEMTWYGQFNLDFFLLLTLAGIWVSWRQGHTLLGLTLGVLTSVGGCMVLCVYLLVAAKQAQGDAKKLLLGVHAQP